MPVAKFTARFWASFSASSGLRLACLAMFVTNWTKGSEHGTMGSMSASDAVPLPRLGEVFFDVRGSSRSMRLSWYADTGISVFSIWQGGTCTGTFRLPQEELPRLIDALQRGMYPDPRGTGGFPRQLPGAPTDPRLTAVPGYGGVREIGREADFTGPVTGDFRALRADDPAGTMVLGSAAAAPRALPPGGGYSDQSRYTDPSQYAEPAQYRDQGYAQQAQYPDQSRYQDQAQYADQPTYATQPQYPDRAYSDQGYSDQGYQDRYGSQGSYAVQAPQPGQRYEDRGYPAPAEPGYQGYGYGEQASAGPDRGDRSYAPSSFGEPTPPGLTSLGSSYSGQDYDNRAYPSQGYDDRGYQQQAYQGQSYSEQGYQGYGYDERGSQSQSLEPHGSYRGQDGQQGYAERGYGQQGYQEDPGQSAHDQYGYPGQDYRDQGYASQTATYSEPGYTGYDYAGDQRSGGYPAGYEQGGYEQGGYERSGAESGRYPNRSYDPSAPAGYDQAAYNGAGYDQGAYNGAGYDQGAYNGAGHGNAGYDGAGYGGGNYAGSGYDGAGYNAGSDSGSGYGGTGYEESSSRSGGHRQVPADSGARDRAQYDDPDVTPSQPMSSFPYDGGPPPEREHRRRRRR
jgi:hypothetical protein